MKMLNLSVGTLIMRLHAMCAIMVTLGFLGYLYLGIVIGMLVFLATLMGLQWRHVNPFRHLSYTNHHGFHHHHSQRAVH